MHRYRHLITGVTMGSCFGRYLCDGHNNATCPQHMDKISMLAFHPVKMQSCYEKVEQLSLEGLQQRFDVSSPSVFVQRAQILMREVRLVFYQEEFATVAMVTVTWAGTGTGCPADVEADLPQLNLGVLLLLHIQIGLFIKTSILPQNKPPQFSCHFYKKTTPTSSVSFLCYLHPDVHVYVQV